MKKQLEHQAAHFYESDPLTEELVEVLKKHCGEEVNGLTSICSTKAIPRLGQILRHLLAPFPDEDRRPAWNLFADKCDELHARMVAEQHRGGSA